jgi:mono/diheme cytochrome c family protein
LKLNTTLPASVFVLALAWSPVHVLGADAAAGKAVYEKNCAGCHGADGKGNPAVTRRWGKKGSTL